MPNLILRLVMVHLEKLAAVRVRQLVAVHAGIEIDSEKPLDITFSHTPYLEALLRDHLLYAVHGLEHLVGFHSLAPADEQELPGCGHLRLRPVQHIHVLLQKLPHLGIPFLMEPPLQVRLVVIETLTGIGAGDLNIRDGGQHHHEVAYLYLDVRVGQHRDIGGGHQEKQELATAGGEPISGEILNAYELLSGAAFLLFL